MASPDYCALRIIDASLNRAAEGLRVVEDYARMVLDDAHLSRLAKDLRHDVGALTAAWHRHGVVAARDTLGDVGTRVTTASEQQRDALPDVPRASCRRVAEALRSIEEYGKLVDITLAEQSKQLRYRLYTLEKAVVTTAGTRQRLASTRLCVLVPGNSSVQTFAELVKTLLAAGVDMVQLRDKQLDDRSLLACAECLASLCHEHAALAIINDRADIAAASGADGVHLGQDDLPAAVARRIVGSHALIGVSTHDIGQARQAVADGADYLGAGPTFPSGTKHFDQFPGLAYLHEVASEVSLPTFAIGGIDGGNVGQVLSTGVTRIAVSGAVTRAADPAAAIGGLRETVARLSES